VIHAMIFPGRRARRLSITKRSRILPRHFVFSGELHANRACPPLHSSRGIKCNLVGAVYSVAAGASAENDVDVLGFKPRIMGGRALGLFAKKRPAWGPNRGLSPCTSATDKSCPSTMHLIWMVVRCFHHRGGFRELLFDVLGIHQQGVARGFLIAQVRVKVRVAGSPAPESCDLSLFAA